MTALRRFALLLVLAAGAIYVGNAWSPSSYGVVLANLGAAGTGLVAGTPRPVRADEYAVVTPLTQATIANGYQRFNRTSLYGEDLRINYGLPLRDWGLAFKPTLWLYGIADPAHAFSFHWFATTALFLAGYTLLFGWLGATPAVAPLVAAGLFFTGCVQFWWSEKGPIFALFPWVLLPFATRLPLPAQAALFAWVAVAWLLTNFYPPVQLTLALVGAALLAAREPSLFRGRKLLVVATATLLAAGAAALYLQDYLAAASATLYPGQRSVGGGTVPVRHFLAWALPAANFDRDFASLIGENISEIGAVGLHYALLTACFLDYARWPALANDGTARRLVTFVGATLLAMLAWMTLPLPSWLGAVLLWDRVPPVRMHFAAGLAVVVLLFVAVRTLGLRMTATRCAVFVALVVAGWWAWKSGTRHRGVEDLVIVPLALAAFLTARRWPAHAHAALLAASTATGAWLVGGFNPLQSARPIFARPATPAVSALDALAHANGGVLAIVGLPGATANGLGFRSVGHVNAVPQLAFWRERFPELDDAQRERLFNRYAHIMPAAEVAPRLVRFDAVFVPTAPFVQAGTLRAVASPGPSEARGGSLDAAAIEDGALVLWGWAPWTGPVATHDLAFAIDAPVPSAAAHAPVLRADLAEHFGRSEAALNGFLLRIPLADASRLPPTCVYALNAGGERVLLANPAHLPYCANVAR